ncbi:MAG: tetratricopeptide repeat protein [Betaproteobacteria bacterium]
MHATLLIRHATRWLGTCLLLGACALALALPAPKDIEAAVSAGHYAQADTMLREVLQEKPNSARAHYELGQVLAHEAKYDEALAQLQRAKAIDGTLKFATSPEKFQQTFDKISAAASSARPAAMTTPVAAPIAPAVAPAPTSPALNLNYVLLGIGVLVLVAFLIRRSNAQAAPSAMPYPAPMPNAAGPVGFGAQYAPNGAAYAPGYGAPAQGGSGMGGAVLGGVAGLAAGYALTKAFEGDHHSGNSSGGAPGLAGNGGYVPFDAPAQPDLGSFDAGAGDGWDASDASTSDDNW